MRDSILNIGWRTCVLTMIAITGLLCLAMGYRAAFAAVTGAWPNSATLAVVSIAAGLGAKWLCENRDALVET